jgi:hypothetical protein
MPRQPSLRASDADRETVTERLRQAAGEGRLEPEELEDRLHAALRARTYGELDVVLADLPATGRRGEELVPAARMAVAVAARVVFTVVVVTLMLLEAALTVAWWALLRAHGFAAARLGPPRRPAGLL